MDANVIIRGTDGVSGEISAFGELLRLQETGEIAISVSSRFIQDKSRDSDLQRRFRHLVSAGQFTRTPAPFRLDVSTLNGPDVLADDVMVKKLISIFPKTATPNLNAPNSLWDIDHLWAHWWGGGDFFLTSDKGILKRRKQLEAIGIRVMSVYEFLSARDAHVAEG